jgi:hypothetical protein
MPQNTDLIKTELNKEALTVTVATDDGFESVKIRHDQDEYLTAVLKIHKTVKESADERFYYHLRILAEIESLAVRHLLSTGGSTLLERIKNHQNQEME